MSKAQDLVTLCHEAEGDSRGAELHKKFKDLSQKIYQRKIHLSDQGKSHDSDSELASLKKEKEHAKADYNQHTKVMANRPKPKH